MIRSRAVVLALAGRASEAETELALLPAVPDDLEVKEKELSRRAFSGRRRPSRGRGETSRAQSAHFASSCLTKRRTTAEASPITGTFRLRVRLADALVTLGRPDEAREELRPVLAINPRFAPALAVIARIEGRATDAKGSAGR